MSRSDFQATPALLSIGEVVAGVRERYPDMTHSSLRFLEREELVLPNRTPGGHRLYSQSDIDRILQIKTWQAQRLSLEQIRQRLVRLDQLPPTDALAATFLRHAVAGERAAAWETVMTADEVGVPLLKLFADVLAPALIEVGVRWERGQLCVAQEKEISELSRDLIVELTARHAPATADAPAIVAGCVEGERHELGLRMICGLLHAQGYRVHFLGADVAPRFLKEAVALRQPDAVLLSATLEAHLFAVRDALNTLSEAPLTGQQPVLAGGEAVRRHADQVITWGAVPIRSTDLAGELAEVTAAVPLVNRKERA